MCTEGRKIMGPVFCSDSINLYSKETNKLQLTGVGQAAIRTLTAGSRKAMLWYIRQVSFLYSFSEYDRLNIHEAYWRFVSTEFRA
jgi:hypothetical protein